ncbi:MAG: hypothetical protein KA479_13885 [Saprospiraceae bacterium]|nr:hypothetical protein [Saprospiraceae bacterium]
MQKFQFSRSIGKWMFLMFLAFVSQQAFAQQAVKHVGGEASIGPRFGGSSGLSFKKHNTLNTSAFEIIGGWNFDENVDGVSLNLMWEKLVPLSGQRLGVILGGGPAFAFGDDFRFGAAGIIGFDWRISNIVNLQVDWQPTWYFVNGSDFSPINAGFTIRYVLNHKTINLEY